MRYTLPLIRLKHIAIALLAITGLFLIHSHASAATLQASPSTLNSVFSSAQGGDTILLSSGSYSFSGGTKSGRVTLRPASGANVTMDASFRPAANITLDSMTISNLDIDGATHDISVLNSTFTGQANLGMTGRTNANILIDHNSFDDIDACGDCVEGRLTIGQNPIGNAPVGVIVSNNHFGGPGQSDGIQVGAYGVIIKGNTFDGIIQANGYTRHVDSLQLYGQSHTTIDGNYFKNFGTAIMAPDGGNTEIIKNNAFISPDTTGSAIQFGHHHNTVFEHNVVKGTDVQAYVLGPDSDPNSGIIMRNNIMISAGFNTNGCVGCSVDHNLSSGLTATAGSPVFVGGTVSNLPNTYLGFALQANSPGHLAGSDGKDLGIDFSGSSSGGGGSTGATYHSADLSALLGHYGMVSGMTPANGDLNGDGAVNVYDLSRMLSDYSP